MHCNRLKTWFAATARGMMDNGLNSFKNSYSLKDSETAAHAYIDLNSLLSSTHLTAESDVDPIVYGVGGKKRIHLEVMRLLIMYRI